MRGARKLFIVLAFAAAAAAGLLWTLRQMRTESSGAAYAHVIFFTESADGLLRGSDVRLNGVKKGRVLTVDLDPRDNQRVRVEFEIRVRIDPARVVGVLETKFPSGQKWINVQFVDRIPGGEPLGAGEIRAVRARSYTHIADKLDKTLEEVKTLLQTDVKDTIVSVRKAVEDIRTFFKGEELQKEISELTNATKDFRSVLNRIDKIIGDNEASAGRIMKAAAEGAEAVQKASVRLDGILQRLDSALGDVNEAGKEMRPRLRETLESVNRSVRMLEETFSEIRDNPSVLLRGRSYEARPIPDR